ncbi:iron-sulfur cluster insertion protein ErpA [Sinorhizobium meliloti WSM1022]|jgi:iron-sulfur cluster assembly accessory protein|uniref:Core domain-containing protein n=5 Tax=Sinorhizobium TaxID=28105 RepID=Q92Q33_RHIME|nr:MULTISPECIES: iron-sulfur cluster insertion protein ErpA [Sinorhizobium]PST26603.1 iron-sulfur cluster assembly accessory protein [Mesorhizobium loti]TWB04903.1 iron-sulfur cluster assembly accessory protein [Ensifer sp. SEMIA 134]TWB36093.1 iron-sulfur cluster assembly accessory protein [Ensifer sp. SEMIA 135]AEG04079.1 iron-sulfur cluster assembly accessory protein [Sinorhizobium meliloti BL225C]AEG53070.1 iron-sulfur cluster assembly accessory protein [Sinorhizobium meliloti AK83]
MQETVTLSDAAARRIAAILQAEKDKSAMRVSVEGGGCSGFSYKFDLVDAANADDLILEKDNAKVLIDSLSLVYMGGSEIDFVDNLLGQSFQINNPNAVASCGCGTSFSI